MRKALRSFLGLGLLVIANGLAVNAQQPLQFDWVKPFSAMSYNDWGSVNSLAVDSSGNIYTVGIFSDTMDFDPGPGTLILTAPAGEGAVFITKSDTAGNLVWAKQLNVGAYGINHLIAIDASANIYVSGYGEGDLDPGPGTYTLPVNMELFLVKLDSAGNFLYAKGVGNGEDNVSVALTLDSSGNIIWLVQHEDMVDSDPGPGVYQSGYSSQFDTIYTSVIKLDSSGDFVWAKTFSTAIEPDVFRLALNAVTTDGIGNIYLAGGFGSSLEDIDPGPAVLHLNPTNGTGLVVKLDAGGNLVWATQMAAYNNVITKDPFGNICVAGTDMNMPPSPNEIVNVTVSRLTSGGNMVWSHTLTGSAINPGPDWSVRTANEIKTDAIGNIYLAGIFRDSLDFDPGPGIYNLNSTGYNGDAFLFKLDSSANLIWAKQIGGDSGVYCRGLALDGDNIYMGGGFAHTADFDPNAGVFNLSSISAGSTPYILKLRQDTSCNMYPIVDSVANVSCAVLTGYASMRTNLGAAPVSYTWAVSPPVYDSFITVTSPGIYPVTIIDANGCVRNAAVFINGSLQQTDFDLKVNNILAGHFQPGLSVTFHLNAFNDGCVPVNGSLKLVLDNLVQYASAVPPPAQISGDTLIWTFSSFNYDSPHLIPVVTLTTDSSTAFGDTLCFRAIMTPITGDAHPADNIKAYCYPAFNSFDPNVKEVYPRGSCAEGYILPNTHLTYTVGFQNTGTATAANIYILDTLDADLNPNTVRVVSNSHPLITELLPGNVLKFSFSGINLPDSNTNEPLSHGYVIYEADHNPGIAAGTQLFNKAAIYFDFNPPIFTNMVKNTVVNTIPVCPTAIPNISKSNGLRIYPNPAWSTIIVEYEKEGTLQLLDIVGKRMGSWELAGGRAQKAESRKQIDVSALPAGVYLYNYITKEGKKSGKLVIQH